jgi:hypothetical protein
MNNLIAVEGAWGNVPRSDPAGNPTALQCLDYDGRNGGVWRGVAYEYVGCTGLCAGSPAFRIAFAHDITPCQFHHVGRYAPS